MKKLIIIVAVFASLLSGCMIRPVHVPPDAFSASSALRIVQNHYRLVLIEEIDGYEDVQMKGMVALYIKDNKQFLLYAFKFQGESPRKYWSKIVKNFGIWSSRTYLDFPTSGLYSTRKSGKEIVVWWKNRWLFIAEGREDTETFASQVMDVYSRIGGRFGW
ncbi:DUF3242 domain-containing protein [Pseudothermotoga thermarum]|uniref:Lipoprotein n=1 Tax=Pseudothermotoga thermarum DSM 5069 TaxID=688269 RepID=F7YVF9_9THEM|nr:DUF3242 domain-containing protein [Pseudothermotoga thermarum]AEH50465.1 hypothetical protein Theth_0370 [Pseudothermotoga thermarum DSM 5069]